MALLSSPKLGMPCTYKCSLLPYRCDTVAEYCCRIPYQSFRACIALRDEPLPLNRIGRKVHGLQQPSGLQTVPGGKAGMLKLFTCSAAGGDSTTQGQPAPDEDRSKLPPEADISADTSSPLEPDWRAFRARLVAHEQLPVSQPIRQGTSDAKDGSEQPPAEFGSTWVHPLPAPEMGCLLVATPKLDGYAFFERSVVLLLNPGGLHGPYGLVLNKPYVYNISGVKGLSPTISKTFGNCRVNVGGPVDEQRFLLLHDIDDVTGFEEVMPGVQFGGAQGMAAALTLVVQKLAQPEDFRFFFGYSGWETLQLEREIANGWWYVAACSSDIVLDKSRANIWEDVLNHMGGEYRDVMLKATNKG